jgi:hypothetical protein
VTSRPHAGLALLLLGAGSAIRLGQYLGGRSLWTDEATLSLNIATRSFGQLAAPLDFHQAAPLGYLWAARAVTSLLGVGELTLRLVPLLAGCALLVVAWRLGTSLLGRRGGLAVLAVTAVSPALAYYSNEAKPYSSDALVAALLLWLGVAVVERRPRLTDTVALALAGAVAVWCSAPAAFVLAGIGLVLGGFALRIGDRARLTQVAAAGIAWAVSFAGAWLAVYRDGGSGGYMQDYWEGGFLSFGSGHEAARSLKESSQVVWNLFVTVPSSSMPVRREQVLLASLSLAVAALAVLGLRRLWRSRGPATALLVASPLLVTAAASLAELYPVSTRLVLFLAPPLVLLVGAGMVSAARLVAPRSEDAALAALAAGFALATLDPMGHRAAASVRWAEAREALAVIAAGPTDIPVYVYQRGLPVYAFYITDWRAPDLERLRQLTSGRDTVRSASGRLELAGHATGIEWRYGVGTAGQVPSPGWARHEARRIREAASPEAWVLFVHDVDGGQEHLLPEIERQGGALRQAVERRRALLYRYEFPNQEAGRWRTSTPEPEP